MSIPKHINMMVAFARPQPSLKERAPRVQLDLTQEQAVLVYNALWAVDPKGEGAANVVNVQVCMQMQRQDVRGKYTDEAMISQFRDAAAK